MAQETPLPHIEHVVHVLQEEARAIEQLALRLRQHPHLQASTEQTLQLLVKTLAAEGRIILTGVGKSGKIAEKISSTLRSVGALSTFMHPTEALHGDLGGIRPPDLVWALSHSGRTTEILALLPYLQKRHIPWIAMTQVAEAPLCTGAAGILLTGELKEADPFSTIPTTSTTVALALGDAMAVALLIQRGTQLQDFSANHPGGFLGDRLSKRLRLRVGDLFQPLSQVALLPPNATLLEAAQALHQKRLGGALIVEDPTATTHTLLGLVTDGDLRRALLGGPSCFQRTAQEIATLRPIVATPDELAWDALVRMEDRPSRLSVLPVVDSRIFSEKADALGPKVLGLLRLHDILQEL